MLAEIYIYLSIYDKYKRDKSNLSRSSVSFLSSSPLDFWSLNTKQYNPSPIHPGLKRYLIPKGIEPL